MKRIAIALCAALALSACGGGKTAGEAAAPAPVNALAVHYTANTSMIGQLFVKRRW